MARVQARQSHIVMGMGPGSMVDLPDDTVVIAGLDQWKYPHGELPVVNEPRLAEKLRGILGVPGLRLQRPPEYVEADGVFHPGIVAYRFPQWVLVQPDRTGDQDNRKRRLVHIDTLRNGKYNERDGKARSVVPIRFVRACPKGHLGDIDWPTLVHGAAGHCGRDLWLEERSTSGDLNDISVVCDCGARLPLVFAARRDNKALGRCDGSRPWLGAYHKEGCTELSRLLVRGASNAYFPQTLSVISIPDAGSEIDTMVLLRWDDGIGSITSPELLRVFRNVPNVAPHLEPYTDDDVLAAIERRRQGAQAPAGSVKDNEFVALSAAKPELGADAPDGDFFARALPEAQWKRPWMEPIERAVLVHRLREVVAQVGFTRFEAVSTDVNGDLDMTVVRAPLAEAISWLPAVENRGEGIFLQFNAGLVERWLHGPAVLRRAKELEQGFGLWQKDHPHSKREFPGAAYIMLHSLSHLLITRIALECGYPASSLRERVYAAPGRYGILLFTGASDSEGTLGGLVQAGRQIAQHMRRALQMGGLCSSDPVCAYQRPASHQQLHLLGSACHGCLLIAETSCEQRNDYLDRSLVVPTLAECGAELFGYAL